MTTHEVTLDLDKTLQLPPPTITARQGDTQCGITAMVTDHGAPATLTGYTAKFQAAKPDGTYAEQAAQISGSTVTVELDPQFLAAAGLIRTAYFRFFEGTAEKESTQNMCIRVIHDAEGEAPDLSTSYIPTVDQLVEDATEALNSANTALGNAEEALEDAEAATDSATDAAASANAAANAAQSAIDAMTGNVLRGTVGPSEVVSVDDAYPQVPLGVKVKGLTRQNLWVNPSGTNNGVTVTSNEDGSVTLSGTATNNSTIQVKTYALKLGTKYYLSVDKTIPGVGNGFGFYIDTDSQSAAYVGNSVASGVSYTPRAEASIVTLGLYIASGITVSGTYRVMLNEGSEAEPWCPPGLNGVDELSIVTAGKNLLARMGPSLPYTTAGITFSDNGDGGIRVSGTATASAYYNFFNSSKQAPFIPAGTYTANLTGKVGGVGLTVGFFDDGLSGTFTSWISDGSSTPATGTLDSPKYLRPYLFVSSGTTVDVVVYPQLELGSTATAYEPPQITTTPIDLDGHTLNSLPDGTCDELRIDGTGAVTLVQRVGVATAPTEASGWTWDSSSGGRGMFSLSAAASGLVQAGNGMCDKLPMRLDGQTSEATPSYTVISNALAYAKNPAITSAATAATVAGGATYLYPLATPKTIPLSAVTLPTLPSPNITVYLDSDVPSDITVEYERDVTIAFDKLQAQVSATTVREATNG